MDLRECTIRFTYGNKGTTTYKVELVNFTKPYRNWKWLFTLVLKGNCYHSTTARDDQELLLLFAKQAIGATTIHITYRKN